MFAPLALTALLIEAVFGYPKWLQRSLGHPVMWIGSLIAWRDSHWNTPDRSSSTRRRLGVLTLVLVVAVSGGIAALLSILVGLMLDHVSVGPVIAMVTLAIAASTLIAQRSLHDHVSDVATALEHEGIKAGRDAVSKIVGRDTKSLNEAEISSAAIESLAENFSDGVVAPVFWLTVAGLPGIAAYKAINTADSMIGHLSDRHRAFGWATAKLDDLVNLPASRMAAMFLIGAAFLNPKASASDALKALRSDARRHRSPNAGWPESAMAGALGLKLGGPRDYDGRLRDDAWMGNGRDTTTPSDINSALTLYRTACAIQAVFLATLSVGFMYLG